MYHDIPKDGKGHLETESTSQLREGYSAIAKRGKFRVGRVHITTVWAGIRGIRATDVARIPEGMSQLRLGLHIRRCRSEKRVRLRSYKSLP